MTRAEILAAIAAERDRQESEGDYSTKYDDRGDLAWAAACYAAPGDVLRALKGEWGDLIHAYPWDGMDRPPHHGEDRTRDLIRAAALCIAEIERLQSPPRDVEDPS